MEKIIENLKKWVKDNYDPEDCALTVECSMGNYDDVFADGERSQLSYDAYNIGMILGMDLEEPCEPEFDY